MKIYEAIIQTAYKYLGEKEIPDNRGWYNKALEAVFKSVGWRYGQHWCAYTMELVWREAYKQYFKDNSNFTILHGIDLANTQKCLYVDERLTKLCSGNSQKTFRNFEKSDIFETGKVPSLGAAVIWKYKGSSGHTAAAVVEIDTDKQVFWSIEGNSGNKVSKNKHKFNEHNILGFIYPKEF